MESKEDKRDPLDLEWLIEQAEAVMKKWKKPDYEPPPPVKPWQEIMDDRIYPAGGSREV